MSTTKPAANTYKRLRLEKPAQHVAHVILSCPERLNAMDGHFFTEVETIFKDLDNDGDVRVILLSAEGKLFTSGLDLKHAASIFNDPTKGVQANVNMYHRILALQESFTVLEKCRKPVIACGML